MNRHRLLPVVITYLLAMPLQAQQPKLTALVGGTLIDGSGGKPIPNSVILLRGERIEKIGSIDSIPIPANYERVSTEGLTVLPGLWDMHGNLMMSVHPQVQAYEKKYIGEMGLEDQIMRASAEQYLMAGVTSIRDPLAPTEASLKLRAQIARGEVSGPTYYTSGAYIEHQFPDWAAKWRLSINGTADAKAKVDGLADKKVDLVMMNCVADMTVEEAKAAVDQAHARGLKVAAHGRANEEIRKCLAAGVDDFQHMSPTGDYPPDILQVLQERAKTRPVGWTVTVAYLTNEDYIRDNPEILDDLAWQRGLPPALVDDVKQSLPAYFAALAQRPRLDMTAFRRKFDQLREAGAQLMVGTDAGANPVASHPNAVWLEMDAWVNLFGMSPIETIRRATAVPAEWMGVQKDYGTVSEGKYGDIIAVHGDPLRHMNVLRDPVIIIKHGKRYK